MVDLALDVKLQVLDINHQVLASLKFTLTNVLFCSGARDSNILVNITKNNQFINGMSRRYYTLTDGLPTETRPMATFRL